MILSVEAPRKTSYNRTTNRLPAEDAKAKAVIKRVRSLSSACSGAFPGCIWLLAAFVYCNPSYSAEVSKTVGDASSAPVVLDSEVVAYLKRADAAEKAGRPDVALIEVKNATRLAPKNGQVRTRLGSMLLSARQYPAAERELRQAWSDGAVKERVVPAILQAMLVRRETNQLLAEFPEPPPDAEDNTTPDILKARAVALGVLGRPKDANAAMDRSLKLRRDEQGLVVRATLAREQNDVALALRLAEEAVSLAPKSEEAAILQISLFRQIGQTQKVVAAAKAFAAQNPQSLTGKILQVEALIDLNQDAKAKEQIDAILETSPQSLLGNYYRAVLRVRAGDFKGAWRIGQNLPPAYVQSEPGIALMVANMAAGSGQMESAGAILTTFVSTHPQVVQARLQLAEVRLSQRLPQAALTVLTPLKTQNDVFVQGLLAQIYLQLQRYDEAIPLLESTLSVARDNNLLKRELALSQMQVGNTNAAIKEFRDLIARNPGDAELAGPLIGLLIQTGRLDDALKIADDVEKASPRSARPAFFRGQILVAKGNLAAAEASFDQTLAEDPKYIPAFFYRSDVSTQRGDFVKSAKDLRKILALDPRNSLAYIKLAQIDLDNKRDSQAGAVLLDAIKALPTQPTLRLALANYQIAHGKFQDALKTVDDLQQISHNNTDGLALRGQILLLTGAKRDAIETLRSLVAIAPQSAAANVLLAKALNSVRDNLAAEDAAKKAVQLAPNSSDVRLILIELQVAQGKTDNALATARDFRSAFPGPQAELLYADALIRLKRSREAAVILENALVSMPDRRLLTRLSEIAWTSGDQRKAVGVLASWLAKHPNDFEVRLRYASYLLMTDPGGARKEFEALLKQRPENLTILNNLSWIIHKDDPARSLSLISLAAKISPRSASIVDTLGWIKLENGDRQGAAAALQQAHNIDARNPAISYHLALALEATGKRAAAKALLQSTLASNKDFDGIENARQLVARW
jgi:putative PEP-CTERM system TPR-repeat lipoprotein